jgi:hypothetical protein
MNELKQRTRDEGRQSRYVGEDAVDPCDLALEIRRPEGPHKKIKDAPRAKGGQPCVKLRSVGYDHDRDPNESMWINTEFNTGVYDAVIYVSTEF